MNALYYNSVHILHIAPLKDKTQNSLFTAPQMSNCINKCKSKARQSQKQALKGEKLQPRVIAYNVLHKCKMVQWLKSLFDCLWKFKKRHPELSKGEKKEKGTGKQNSLCISITSNKALKSWGITETMWASGQQPDWGWEFVCNMC